MSFSLGQTLAGLLNASFGNAVEIIVGIAALMQGRHSSFPLEFTLTRFPDEIRIVQTSVRRN